MNWNTLVHQLGWQDLVEKWEASENLSGGKIQVESNRPDIQEYITRSQKQYPFALSAEKQQDVSPGHYSAYFHSILSSLENSDENNEENDKNNNTNPFIVSTETPSALTSSPSHDNGLEKEFKLNSDSWFYLDPHGIDQGPFGQAEMAAWYDCGYFEAQVKVRKAGEIDYITISDLIKEKSKEMFPTFSPSELVPEEYVHHATSMINPFCLSLRKVESANCTKVVLQSEKKQIMPERYSFKICRRLKSLSVKEVQEDSENKLNGKTPIKFNISGPRNKCLPNLADDKAASIETKTPPKSFLAKIDKFKSDWLSVASTKLLGQENAKCVQVILQEKTYDAHIEAEARISFLGAGSLDFLNEHKIIFTKYTNESRTVKTDCGASAKIIGDVLIPITYQETTIQNFKFLIAPDLESFIYLGCDFQSKFIIKDDFIPNKHIELDLTPKKKEELDKVIKSFPCIENLGLGFSNLISYSIMLTGNVVPFNSPITYASASSIGLKVLNEMIDLGIIEPSTSPWNLSAITVFKENDESFYLDLRKINAKIKPVSFSFPNKNEILKQIKNSSFISTFDLSSLIRQIPLEVKSRQYTAFTILEHPTCYQFKRIPFGLKNMHHEVHRLIDKLFPNELRKLCVIASDMLFILSDNFASHISHLTKVAERLSEANLAIDAKKSSFCVKSVKCFGYIIESNTIKTDPKAWKPISNITRPETKKRLKLFLQIAEWLRDLIPNYDKVIAPLKLMCKSRCKELNFSEDAREAFAYIKTHLTSDAVITGPKYGRPFYVQCNVNFKIIAGLLYQLDKNDEKLYIAYCVKELSSVQEKMMVSELECLAVVTCLKHFQRYLERERFFVLTDESILCWILNEFKLPEVLARLCIELQKFDFTIQQRHQIKSIELDVLCRVDSILLNEVKNSLTDSKQYCLEYNSLRKRIVNSPHEYFDYKIENNLVYCRREFSGGNPLTDQNIWKIFMPENLRKNLLQRAHINAFGNHRSRKEMKKYLESAFYWPLIEADIRTVINKCSDCRDRT